jgi:3'(2'), 5'-bisphosphate nucleotidase
MNRTQSHPSLEAVATIARQAGGAILGIYDSEFAVAHKDDQSPLTEADLAAHRLIVDALQALAPDLPVLSEEAADIAFAERSRWTRYWLVDPLDGTKEFIKRNGEFTVNIALIENGVPVLGVVHAPALKLTYAAAQGDQAWVERDGVRRPLRTRPVAQPATLVVSRSHKDAALEQLLARMPAHEAVSRGSSLKFCLVAEGVADAYPRTGPTSEWDTAAGHCVVECAGGRVLRLPDYAPLRYNQKDSLLNPPFVVLGDPDAPWREWFSGGG